MLDVVHVHHHDGSGDQGRDGTGGGSALPVVAQHVGEEGPGGAEGEAEHQQGHDAAGVEQRHQHGGSAADGHGDLGDPHDLLAGGFGVDEGMINVVGEDGTRAQQVGVSGGHGGGDDAREEQAADDGGHDFNGQHRQRVTRAHISELGGTELPHVDERQGDDAQDGGDEGIDEVHQRGQDGALAGGLAVTGGVVAGDRLLAHREGGHIHDGQGNHRHGAVALEHIEGPLGHVGRNVLPASGHVHGEGHGDDHADDDQEHLDEVGEGHGPQSAHDGVQGHHHRHDDHGSLIVDAQHGGQDDRGGDELAGGSADQGQEHDDGGDEARALAIPAAEILRNGLDGGRPELGGQEGQDHEGEAHGDDIPRGGKAVALHALLDHAQGTAAADLGGGQGTGHQQGPQAASGHHEVRVGRDLLGGIPSNEEHDQQIDHDDRGNDKIDLHIISPILSRFVQKILCCKMNLLSRIWTAYQIFPVM